MDLQWLTWIRNNYSALKGGACLQAPWWLAHPSRSGFERPEIAEPVGQKDNWVASVDDGSRVHLHEYADGRIVAHRDPTDPARGPISALWHWLTESRSGKTALIVGGLALLAGVGSTRKRRK